MNAFFNGLSGLDPERLFKSVNDTLEGLDFSLGLGNHVLVDTEDKLILEIDMPGVDKESINLSFDEKYLNVTATRKEVPEGKLMWDGRGPNTKKRFEIKARINQDATEAEYVDGVLRVTLPKDSSGKIKVNVK